VGNTGTILKFVSGWNWKNLIGWEILTLILYLGISESLLFYFFCFCFGLGFYLPWDISRMQRLDPREC